MSLWSQMACDFDGQKRRNPFVTSRLQRLECRATISYVMEQLQMPEELEEQIQQFFAFDSTDNDDDVKDGEDNND